MKTYTREEFEALYKRVNDMEKSELDKRVMHNLWGPGEKGSDVIEGFEKALDQINDDPDSFYDQSKMFAHEESEINASDELDWMIMAIQGYHATGNLMAFL